MSERATASVAALAREWPALARRVFWDREVPLQTWRERVREGHRSYLPDSVSRMTPAEFVKFYGSAEFASDWPAMREQLPAQALAKAPIHDVAWSRLNGGGWNLKPRPGFAGLPARRKMFLTEAARDPGRSIYEYAKALGLQYRRAHDHAQALLAQGWIKRRDVVEAGRRKARLYPV